MISHDKWYKKWNASSVNSACIIRVTNRCNQRCTHCAFRSGPDCVGQMSIETCKKINTWVPAGIVMNIMGGEVTFLANYPEILVALASRRRRIRLVTNGYWGDHDSDKFFDAIKKVKENSCKNVDVAISNDDWHKKGSYKARTLLQKNNLGIGVIDIPHLSIYDITPIGRAWDNNLTINDHIPCSCKTMCNMIITEDGMLCRCPYGYFPWKHFSETTWFDAQEYIWGWRSEKLADGMDCISCMKTVESNELREKEDIRFRQHSCL